MECNAIDWTRMAAILAVTADGVAQVVHVHPDLVFAPGLYFKLNHCKSFTLLDESIAGYSKSPYLLVVGRVHLKCFGILGKEALDGTLGLWNVALDHSNVLALDKHVVPIADEDVARLLGASEEHKARGVTVETVHNVDVGFWAESSRIFLDDIENCVVAGLACSCREHPIALVDNNDVVVFIDEPDAWMAEDLE